MKNEITFLNKISIDIYCETCWKNEIQYINGSAFHDGSFQVFVILLDNLIKSKRRFK